MCTQQAHSMHTDGTCKIEVFEHFDEKIRFLADNRLFSPDLELSHRSELLSYEAPMVLILKL